MRRITVIFDSPFENLLFFTCIGDEKGVCDTCRVRFFCHTGDIPNSVINIPFNCGWYDEFLEKALFGRDDLFYMEYDLDAHCKHYKVTRKNEWRTRRQRVKLPR